MKEQARRVSTNGGSCTVAYTVSRSGAVFKAIFTEDGAARHSADIIHKPNFGVHCIFTGSVPTVPDPAGGITNSTELKEDPQERKMRRACRAGPTG